MSGGGACLFGWAQGNDTIFAGEGTPLSDSSTSMYLQGGGVANVGRWAQELHEACVALRTLLVSEGQQARPTQAMQHCSTPQPCSQVGPARSHSRWQNVAVGGCLQRHNAASVGGDGKPQGACICGAG